MITSRTLRRAMHTIAARKGEFALFAVFMRSNGLGLWDLVVAAPWMKKERYEAMKEIARLLRDAVGESALRWFSRVAPVEMDDPSVKFILANMPVDDGEIRVRKPDLFGVEFSEAIIFRAKEATPARTGASRRTRTPAAIGSRRKVKPRHVRSGVRSRGVRRTQTRRAAE